MKDRLEWWQATRAWRAWTCYGKRRGNVLAAGMAYVSFFSLFPALALGFAALGTVVGGDSGLQRRLVDSVNQLLGNTVIGLQEGEGLVWIGRLTDTDLLTVTGALGAGVLLFSGLGWVNAARQGIRAMFDLPDEGNPFVLKAFDVLVLLLLGFGVVLSVVVTVVLTTAGGQAVGWLGIDGPFVQDTLRIVVDLAILVFDIGLFLLLFRLLARIDRPWRDLLSGAVIGGVGLLVLKLSGGLLLRLASGNRFLASISIVVGLLIWLNLAARLILLSAAWSAIREQPDPTAETGPATEHPAALPAPDRPVSTPVPTPVPTYGTVAADRVTLAAGAVLGSIAGALGVAALGGLRRGVAQWRDHGDDEPDRGPSRRA